jgi:prolyl oligopeptidase
LIAEEQHSLQSSKLVGNQLVLEYLVDATSELRVVDLDDLEVRIIDLPGLGSAGGFSGKQNNPELFFWFTSPLHPPQVYRYDLDAYETAVFREPELDVDPDKFIVRREFVTSKDGTRVPLLIAHRKDVEWDATNPTLLYGYGGFNISITPSFSVENLVWMELGGVYAAASLRGGGEYGRDWHEAGTQQHKQNVFDDFIATAEWLIDHKVTTPANLGIYGRSNGGLLVAATVLQRPDLFGAVIPAVGVLDMLRYHKFTIGWAWASDYGTADDPEMFEYLLAYSPVHNTRSDIDYPPILVTTADYDDRVVPAHSYKFTAALQAAQRGIADPSRPSLIRIETRAGHGAGKSVQAKIEESTDMWGFLAGTLGVPLENARALTDGGE